MFCRADRRGWAGASFPGRLACQFHPDVQAHGHHGLSRDRRNTAAIVHGDFLPGLRREDARGGFVPGRQSGHARTIGWHAACNAHSCSRRIDVLHYCFTTSRARCCDEACKCVAGHDDARLPGASSRAIQRRRLWRRRFRPPDPNLWPNLACSTFVHVCLAHPQRNHSDYRAFARIRTTHRRSGVRDLSTPQSISRLYHFGCRGRQRVLRAVPDRHMVCRSVVWSDRPDILASWHDGHNIVRGDHADIPPSNARFLRNADDDCTERLCRGQNGVEAYRRTKQRALPADD